MKITWKHVLITAILFIFTFILSSELSQPYKLYVAMSSIGLLISSLVLCIIADIQYTRRTKLDTNKELVAQKEMELKIIGETGKDFLSDLQKLAIKHKVAIITGQQKSKPILNMTEVVKSFKKVFQSDKKVDVRQTPNSARCPFCTSTDIMIYDQEHDCCFCCSRKWEIKEKD